MPILPISIINEIINTDTDVLFVLQYFQFGVNVMGIFKSTQKLVSNFLKVCNKQTLLKLNKRIWVLFTHPLSSTEILHFSLSM